MSLPLSVMIWIAAGIEAGIQDWVDMGILLFIQFINAFIGYYEITKASDAGDYIYMHLLHSCLYMIFIYPFCLSLSHVSNPPHVHATVAALKSSLSAKAFAKRDGIFQQVHLTHSLTHSLILSMIGDIVMTLDDEHVRLMLPFWFLETSSL